MWVETVEGLGNAYELMTKVAAETPGPYFIVSRKTHTIVSDWNWPSGSKGMFYVRAGESLLGLPRR